MASPPEVSKWTPEQIANAKRWVQTWKRAGPELERLRRQELRQMDPARSIELLCGPEDYTVPPRALVEQQRWFMKAVHRAYIDRELRPLAELKEAPEILSELEERRRELEP